MALGEGVNAFVGELDHLRKIRILFMSFRQAAYLDETNAPKFGKVRGELEDAQIRQKRATYAD